MQFDKEMAAKPLTDEEKQQLAAWQNIIFGEGKVPSIIITYFEQCMTLEPGPFEPLDDVVDEIIAWSEGHGEFPTVPLRQE